MLKSWDPDGEEAPATRAEIIAILQKIKSGKKCISTFLWWNPIQKYKITCGGADERSSDVIRARVCDRLHREKLLEPMIPQPKKKEGEIYLRISAKGEEFLAYERSQIKNPE